MRYIGLLYLYTKNEILAEHLTLQDAGHHQHLSELINIVI